MIKILAVDDHAIIRQGLRQILAEHRQLRIAGEAGTGRELFQKLDTDEWNLVLLDVSLPDRNGVEVLKEIRDRYPELPVLILSVHDDVQYAIEVLKAGAAGYLTKESAPAELIQALEAVAAGGRYISHSLASKLVLESGAENEQPLHQSLSKRELEVLRLIASGKSVKDVGSELGLSVKTVSTHRVRILKKMGMKRNAELIRYALDNKLVG